MVYGGGVIPPAQARIICDRPSHLSIAEIHEGQPFIYLSIIPLVCPRNNIGISIPIGVTRSGDGTTIEGVNFIRFCCPGNRSQARGRTVEGVSPAFIRLAVVIIGRAGNHIRVPVAVHIPRAGHAVTKIGVRLVDFLRPCGGHIRSGGRTMETISPAFIRLTIVIIRRAHNHVRISVAVHIPSAGHGIAELRVVLVSLRRPGGGWKQCGGGAQEHACTTLVGLVVVVEPGADDGIAVSVGVHIPGGGNGEAELRVVLAALRGPCGRRGRTGG